MTEIKNRSEQNVCNECGRHCPLDELRCDKGRRAAGLHDSTHEDEQSHDRNHEDHEGHRHGREHGEHEGHRRGHHAHRFDLEATGDPGLYARLRQCGHYLFHSGKEQSSQKKVLIVLSEHKKGLTQRELTEILGIHRASASELLGKLEKKGLILRTADDQDRRQVKVSLTEAGRKELPDDSDEQNGLTELFSALTDEEKDTLYHILGKLIQTWGCDKKESK